MTTNAVAQVASDLPHALSGGLEGVAQELILLRDKLLRMQDACSASDMGAVLDAVVIREVQGLDLATQRLDGLAAFVRELVDALPFDPAMDLTEALGGVTLQDMSDRLSSYARGLGAPELEDDPASGDFDLF